MIWRVVIRHSRRRLLARKSVARERRAALQTRTLAVKEAES
jgi:hypothetical protein